MNANNANAAACPTCVIVDPDRTTPGVYVIRAKSCPASVAAKFNAVTREIEIASRGCVAKISIYELMALADNLKFVQAGVNCYENF